MIILILMKPNGLLIIYKIQIDHELIQRTWGKFESKISGKHFVGNQKRESRRRH